MLKNASNHGEASNVTLAPWETKSQLRMLFASKAAFLENYFAVRTWILNGSLIECAQEEASTFQFILCLIWKLGDSNFWAKICFALEE